MEVSMKKMTIDPSAVSDPVALRAEFRKTLAMISGKWKLEILWLLNQRTHRFGELRRAIPGITQHMLTAQLRELEVDKLILRKIFPEVPPRVEYSLTPRAKNLKPVIDAVFTFGVQCGKIVSYRPGARRKSG